jgi:O-antigen ligase
MRNHDSAQSPSLLDMVGPISLGAYIFYIVAIVMNTAVDSRVLHQLARVLALTAFLTNLRRLRLSQIGSPMLWAVVLFVYSAFTASWDNTGERPQILTYAEYTVIAFCLSLVVTERAQLIAVMGALAASAIFVAYANHGAMHESAQAISQAGQLRRDISDARTGGTFLGDANSLGMYAVVAVVAAVTLYFSTGKRSMLALSAVSSICAAYLAFFTGSRTAILGMAVTLAFVLWLALRLRKAIGRLAVVAALALVGGGGVWIYNNPYLSRFDMGEASFVGRRDLLRVSWGVWLHDPIIGVGYDTFVKVSGTGHGTHCTPLEVLCNGGLVGLGIYAAFWWRACKSLRAGLAAHPGAKEAMLLYCTGLYLTVLALFSMVNFTYQDEFYLVLNGCVLGYLRSREFQFRQLRRLDPRKQPEGALGSAKGTVGLEPSIRQLRGYLRSRVLQSRGMRPLYSSKRAAKALGGARCRFGPKPFTRQLRGPTAWPRQGSPGG